MSLFVFICLYFSLFVFYLSLFVFICLYLCLFVFICLYLSLFVFICFYLFLFIFICLYLSLFVFICFYLSLFVFICLYLSLICLYLSLFVKICRSCRTSPVDLIPVVLVRCKRPMISVLQLDFRSGDSPLDGFDGIFIQFPPPPSPGCCAWEPRSCSLRALRSHSAWLESAFGWIRHALLFAGSGRLSGLDFPFSPAFGGRLAQWLLDSTQLSLEPSALLLRFTS